MRDAMRIIIEQGRCEVEFCWTAPLSADSVSMYDDECSPAPGWFSGTADDLLWLTEPGKVNLLDSELDDFYVTVVFQQCLLVFLDPQILVAAFSRVRDLGRLAKIRDESARTFLHYVILRLSFVIDSSDEVQICELISSIIQAGADLHALDDYGDTPLMYALYQNVALIPHSERCPPTKVSRWLSDGLNAWLKLLSSTGVDLRQYICTERELGAEDPIRCYIGPVMVKRNPEDFLDQDWYAQLGFIDENDGVEDASNPDSVKIEVEYFSVKRKYPTPGDWPGDETDASEHSDGSSYNDKDEQAGDEPTLEVDTLGDLRRASYKEAHRRRNSI